jgi:hypothetical protein
MALPPKATFHVSRLHPHLLDTRDQLVPRNAEDFHPVLDLVCCIEVDTAAIGGAANSLVVCHVATFHEQLGRVNGALLPTP